MKSHFQPSPSTGNVTCTIDALKETVFENLAGAKFTGQGMIDRMWTLSSIHLRSNDL